jgi:catechol 2,3-dioxygenase-like lactoylglutathione lyase family enzyme
VVSKLAVRHHVAHCIEKPVLRHLDHAIAVGEVPDEFARARTSTCVMLRNSRVATRIPAEDLERARRFYAEKLGLEPLEERPGGLRYECGGGLFSLFESTGKPSGTHTQMAWEVDDIEETVRVLRSRGVVFEEYEFDGLRTVKGIAEVDGNYPSTGAVAERGAWFRDSEGNLLGIGQAARKRA